MPGHLELLTPKAKPGDRVYLQGIDNSDAPVKKIDIKRFQKCPITVTDGAVVVGSTPLCIAGTALRMTKLLNGKVG